jgi:hypothetical protein
MQGELENVFDNISWKLEIWLNPNMYLYNHWIVWKSKMATTTEHLCYPLANEVAKGFDLWPWKSIGFQILLRTKYVPSLVKIHWRMLILECSQGCDGRTVALLYPFLENLKILQFSSLVFKHSLFANKKQNGEHK